jgi:hypothetical protein
MYKKKSDIEKITSEFIKILDNSFGIEVKDD